MPNGRIHPTVRLACFIRICAGGDPLDLILIYDISKTEVHDSLNYVIDAVNETDALKIIFPDTFEKQKGLKNYHLHKFQPAVEQLTEY